jgi:hypothetical protein
MRRMPQNDRLQQSCCRTHSFFVTQRISTCITRQRTLRRLLLEILGTLMRATTLRARCLRCPQPRIQRCFYPCRRRHPRRLTLRQRDCIHPAVVRVRRPRRSPTDVGTCVLTPDMPLAVTVSAMPNSRPLYPRDRLKK